jgi:hypothetical protein
VFENEHQDKISKIRLTDEDDPNSAHVTQLKTTYVIRWLIGRAPFLTISWGWTSYIIYSYNSKTKSNFDYLKLVIMRNSKLCWSFIGEIFDREMH